jgi:DNA primase
MRIPQSTVDQILDRTDLVELIGSRIKLKKAGKNYTACCPFHQEKSPSFNVQRDKGFYHCFGCQASGNAIGFLMNYENRSFIESINELAQRAGIELPKRDSDAAPQYKYAKGNTTDRKPTNKKPLQPSTATTSPKASPTQPHALDQGSMGFDPFDLPSDDDQDTGSWYPDDASPISDTSSSLEPNDQREGNLYDLLEDITLFYQQQLQQHAPARQYLSNRGLDGEACTDWRLGYAPTGWQHLEQQFPQDIDGLKALGLVRTSEQGREFDLLRDRVIFPIRDRKGRVVGFGGRAMDDTVKPKYINSPESAVFQKSHILYGLYESRKAKPEHWLMVEGYMDVIALHQAGLAGAVATLGTATNSDHLEMLFRHDRRVTLAFDGDNAGQRAAWRTLELALPALSDGRELHFLVLPAAHDPDSLVRLEGASGLRQRIENAPPLSDYLYETLSRQFDLNRPEGKSSLMNEAQKLLVQLPQHGAFRQLLRQSLRERLGIGWKARSATPKDHLISFEQGCSLEEKALLLLLHYPVLAKNLHPLVEHSAIDQPLGQLLRLLQQCQGQLPEDPDHALCFLLGAWPDQQGRLKLCQLLDHVDIDSYVQRPERLEGLCQELSLQLTEASLIRQLRQIGSSDLARVQALKNQVMAIQHRLHFREPIPMSMDG